ncbi:Transposase for insertion sequence element IS629 [Rhodococcus opacus]|uniref:Transposase for insertion sequence element IS629 n=1 Tax=Rhodococcus opacus TaxID=37919 RepID=A0A1B1K7X8_RHOOP|nr:Transposase for insertion sequence element IS629 [Rhodococcus opacus]ANS28725.1 Transposase for insertion sequence element IS629 [Rhodococcus opacus]
MIVDYIDAHRSRFGVDPICAVLTEHGISIAPSTYYKAKQRGRISSTELADAYAANAVHTLFVANKRVYGARKLWRAMKRAGHDIGRDQVARLMAITGITGAVRGKHHTITTQRDDRAPRHPDLIERNWDAPWRPDQWWVADFTYVWTLAGFVYTAFCVDVFSRRILGWRVMTTKSTPLVSGVLEQALFTRRRTDFRFTSTGLVHHSDAGSQYTSLAFTEALVESGIAGSIGSVGDALDNALMESTIGLYKAELINRTLSWSGRAEVERETAEWVRWFNADRLHSSIDYLPPIDYETRYREQRPTVASILEVA